MCVGFTKKTGYTRGGTTSQSKNEEDENWFYRPDGTKVSIVPKPLVQVPGAKPEGAAQEGATQATEAGKDKSKTNEPAFNAPAIRVGDHVW